jgi:hypothetical protein
MPATSAVDLPDDELPRDLPVRDGRDLDALRGLKVKLPLRHHLKLQTLRVYHGHGISETVSAALEAYFASLPREMTAPQPAEPMLEP